MSTMRLILHLADDPGRTLTVGLRDEFIIGRSSADFAPEVDLAAYQAAELGVSRRHGRFTYDGDNLYLEDLESVSGTRINGLALIPGQKYRVRNGDELELGRLRLNVRLVRAPRSLS